MEQQGQDTEADVSQPLASREPAVNSGRGCRTMSKPKITTNAESRSAERMSGATATITPAPQSTIRA